MSDLRFVRVAALCLVVWLAGCSGDQTSTATTTTAVAAATTTAVAETTTSAVDATTTTAAMADLHVNVGGDGLIIVDNSGSTAMLDFGTPKENVLIGVTNSLGAPASDNAGNAECGNGQGSVATWTDQLVVEFGTDDTLIGWSLPAGSPLTDFTGVGLGSALAAVGDGTVGAFESSLGYEFSVSPNGGGLAGLVTGTGSDATITDLWAGSICIFR